MSAVLAAERVDTPCDGSFSGPGPALRRLHKRFTYTCLRSLFTVCIPLAGKDVTAPSSTLERRPPGAQWSTPDTRSHNRRETSAGPLGDKSKQQPPLSAPPAEAVSGMRACHIDLADHRLAKRGNELGVHEKEGATQVKCSP